MAAPSAAAPGAVEIIVTTTADALNGEAVTVERLHANPGPDGLSLREAVEATNADRGTYTIRFAPSLAGKTIVVLSRDGRTPFRGPFMLIGGGVSIDGDVDGDGKADVTLRPDGASRESNAFHVLSSGNRLHALRLEGFGIGVLLQPVQHPGVRDLPRTFDDNTLSGLVIRGLRIGIELASSIRAGCDFWRSPCSNTDTWTDLAITGNTIETNVFGLSIVLNSADRDRIERLTVTGNGIRLGRQPASEGGAAIQIGAGTSAMRARISDVLVARNSIETLTSDGGIVVGAGLQRTQRTTIERVRILDNRIHHVRSTGFCCQAITVYAGVDSGLFILEGKGRPIRPFRYPHDNVVRDVQIIGNVVSGSLVDGVKIGAGVDGGASRNRIENVRIERNTIRSTIMGKGVFLWTGHLFPPTYATGNRIRGVTIEANRITTGKPLRGDPTAPIAGGVVLVSGWDYSRNGVVRNVRIARNRITTAQAGIRLVGGIGPTAHGNSVSCVRLSANVVRGTRNAVVVTPNLSGLGRIPGRARGNRATLRGC